MHKCSVVETMMPTMRIKRHQRDSRRTSVAMLGLLNLAIMLLQLQGANAWTTASPPTTTTRPVFASRSTTRQSTSTAGYSSRYSCCLGVILRAQQDNVADSFSVVTANGDSSTSKSTTSLLLRSTITKIQDSLLLLLHQVDTSTSNTTTSNTFVALTIKGPSKKMAQKLPDKDQLRGCLRLLTGRLILVNNNNKKKQKRVLTKRNTDTETTLLLQMTFKYHGATDIVKNWELASVEANLLSLLLQLPPPPQSATDGDDNNDIVAQAASEWGQESLQTAPGSLLGVQGIVLETVEATWELDIGARARHHGLVRRAAAAAAATSVAGSTSSTSRALAHDRTKQVPLSNQADFLKALGVTNDAGKPKQGMTSKLRQCQKFVEIVGRLVDRCIIIAEPNANGSGNDNGTEISIVDAGCGRAYLTFSLHSYLQEKYGSSGAGGHKVQSRGIDVRPKLVQEISSIARSLDSSFDSLTFEQGTIEDFLVAPTDSKEDSSNSLDVLIALHACDTATDDALWSGIARQANVIVVAPCCHKQVRSQLDTHVSKNPNHPLADVFRHNIYRERLAETVTDSIRALLLETAGYTVQVFEFIGGEHTSKNVMITGVKQASDQAPLSAADQDSLRQRLQSLAALHGIRQQKLANWMDTPLHNDAVDVPSLSARNMPPL